MKSSLLHHRREGLDVNQGRRSGRCRSNVNARKSQGLEISVLDVGRPGDGGAKLQPSMCLREAARLAENVYVLARSRRLFNLSRPKRTASNSLPPISKSRVATSRVEQTKTSQAQRPTNKLWMEKAVCHVLIAQGRKLNWESSKSNKIRAVCENKAAAQQSETGSRLIKQTFDGHRPAPAQTTPDPRGPTADAGPVVLPLGVKHDASLPVTKEQRDFCSDDSAIETESEGSQDKGCLEGLEEEEDEYYTEQRISEWVLRVNASLFSVGDGDRTTSKPVEEQDVATVKIVYSGD